MKKYLSITKMVVLEQFQYIFNKLTGLIMYGLFIFLFLYLWKYMYGEEDFIAGYSLNQMVWYVSITEILWNTIRPSKLRKELRDDIKSGKIAYILNKPYDFINYLLAKDFGNVIVSTLIYGIAGTLISLLIVGKLQTFVITSIPFIIITLLFATFITAFVYIAIGLLGFWFEDSDPFFWVYEKFILVIGVVFPVEVFPSFIQPFIKFSPIYATIYAPSKMIVDFSINSFLEILLFQVGYLILFYVLCKIIYKKGEKKLSVNGG